MSSAYQDGPDYFRTYSGLLKVVECTLTTTLIIFATLLTNTYQAQFLCGLCIYGFVSAVALLALHIRGLVKKSEFPWFWVEFINSGLMTVLLLVASTSVAMVLTKGYIITSIVGFVAVLIYSLDSIDRFTAARTPRARYVWTVPNATV
ncbi:hypothetical protein ABEB36_009895 [Hypothenemus hampei]|uniref:MARVEL domain-containing protein n=1 Tax=Hypothenemus hampei TaxID=57062 RepID=A0ABD1EHU1_HYPHA